MLTEQVNATKSDHSTGLWDSLRRLLASFAEILHTRLAIISTELEEAGWRVGQLLLYGLASIFFLGLGLLMATFFVIKASPETYQLYVLGGFAIFYLGISAIAALMIRYLLKSRPRLFSTTLSELRKDRRHLDTRS